MALQEVLAFPVVLLHNRRKPWSQHPVLVAGQAEAPSRALLVQAEQEQTTAVVAVVVEHRSTATIQAQAEMAHKAT